MEAVLTGDYDRIGLPRRDALHHPFIFGPWPVRVGRGFVVVNEHLSDVPPPRFATSAAVGFLPFDAEAGVRWVTTDAAIDECPGGWLFRRHICSCYPMRS